MQHREWEILIDRNSENVIISDIMLDDIFIESEESATLFLEEFYSACMNLGWTNVRRKTIDLADCLE